jgi:hypothetical protein
VDGVAEATVAQVHPVLDVAGAHANDVRQSVAGHVGEERGRVREVDIPRARVGNRFLPAATAAIAIRDQPASGRHGCIHDAVAVEVRHPGPTELERWTLWRATRVRDELAEAFAAGVRIEALQGRLPDPDEHVGVAVPVEVEELDAVGGERRGLWRLREGPRMAPTTSAVVRPVREAPRPVLENPRKRQVIERDQGGLRVAQGGRRRVARGGVDPADPGGRVERRVAQP